MSSVSTATDVRYRFVSCSKLVRLIVGAVGLLAVTRTSWHVRIRQVFRGRLATRSLAHQRLLLVLLLSPRQVQACQFFSSILCTWIEVNCMWAPRPGKSASANLVQMLIRACRAANTRLRRVRFQPPKIAPEPSREIAAPPQGSMKGKNSGERHWPPEIPADMVFAYKVNPGPEIRDAAKEPQFQSHGPLQMFEYVFQLDSGIFKTARQVGQPEQVKPSPSQSSDSGTTDEPRTPADMQDVEVGISQYQGAGSALPGSLGPWPVDANRSISISSMHSAMEYAARHASLGENAVSNFLGNGGKDSYGRNCAPQLDYTDDVQWHHSFLTTDIMRNRESESTAYDERRHSLASTRETSTSPFDSQSNSDSSHLSADDINLRRLSHQVHPSMLHGHHTVDTVSPSMLTKYETFNAFPSDPRYSPLPSHAGKSHDGQYPEHVVAPSCGMSHSLQPSYPEAMDPHPRGWDNGPAEGCSSSRVPNVYNSSAASEYRGLPAMPYHHFLSTSRHSTSPSTRVLLLVSCSRSTIRSCHRFNLE